MLIPPEALHSLLHSPGKPAVVSDMKKELSLSLFP